MEGGQSVYTPPSSLSHSSLNPCSCCSHSLLDTATLNQLQKTTLTKNLFCSQKREAGLRAGNVWEAKKVRSPSFRSRRSNCHGPLGECRMCLIHHKQNNSSQTALYERPLNAKKCSWPFSNLRAQAWINASSVTVFLFTFVILACLTT